MKKFEPRTYNIAEIIEWDSSDQLVLSPDFQRRSVWSENAKSYLIDTVLTGKPMPKIFMAQKVDGAKNKKIIIDGQQRLRALLDFYKGTFAVKKIHNDEYGGKTYEDLDSETQKEFLKYNLSFDVLFELPIQEILDVFARINSYTVPLNKQELYNARYVGNFKQLASKYGVKYVSYFIDGNILTKAKIARMGEIELSADLLTTIIGGVQSSSNIEGYYKKYEDQDIPRKNAGLIFDTVMSYVGAIYTADDISNTIWKKSALFYTLFIFLANSLYGIDKLAGKKKLKINKNSIGRLRVLLDDISSQYKAYNDDREIAVPKDFEDFFMHATKGTTNAIARIYRINYLTKRIGAKLSK
jgi:hypothetical protein